MRTRLVAALAVVWSVGLVRVASAPDPPGSTSAMVDGDGRVALVRLLRQGVHALDSGDPRVAAAAARQALALGQAGSGEPKPWKRVALELLVWSLHKILTPYQLAPWAPANATGVTPSGEAAQHLLHIAKNGGTSIAAAVQGESSCGGTVVVHDHHVRRSNLSTEAAVVAVVRDPIDRFLAAFRFFREGGLRGSYRRRSDALAAAEAVEMLQVVDQLVELTEAIGTAQDAAEALMLQSKLVWAFEGDAHRAAALALRAYAACTAAAAPDGQCQVEYVRAVNFTIQHPIHAFAGPGELVDGLQQGRRDAWRVLYCQENYHSHRQPACLGGEERSPDLMQVVFRPQAYWLDGAMEAEGALLLVPFPEIARHTGEPLRRLGIDCDAILPHLNGRTSNELLARRGTPVRGPSEEEELTPAQAQWLRNNLYAQDAALYDCLLQEGGSLGIGESNSLHDSNEEDPTAARAHSSLQCLAKARSTEVV
uniref:Protein-tyrosine sulfotransferase n=1 Tax=Rhizochromulina marina TaxID=1034831 RepID=A0A7S2SVD4_9STRA|mmetsp:Transcript_738/g.2371  ORF Transcript_738/g.2371 Transcript_738/m.2371 type:complete len:480 (+) Transcript_738:96-1535(+)